MVEHGFLQHLAEIGMAIKRNWYWLLTIIPVIFWSFKYVISKKLDGDYMSRAEVIKRIDEVEENFNSRLDDHEEREFARQDRFDKQNQEAHKSLIDKVDHLTDVIIDGLRK